MADQPTWEQVVTRVTIASNYYEVQRAADQWAAAFRQLGVIQQKVTELSGRTESWKGGGANAFRAHLQKIDFALRDAIAYHGKITDGLTACADHLRTAVQTIPVPTWMSSEVAALQQRASNEGLLTEVTPGTFWQGVQRMATGYEYATEWLRTAEEVVRNFELKAQAAYAALVAGYGSAAGHIPTGTPVPFPIVNDVRARTNGSGRGAGPARTPTNPLQNPGQQPGQQQPGLGQQTGQPPTMPGTLPGTVPGLDPGTVPGFTPPDLDPAKPIGTGLAGATPDLGGLGSLGGGGVGGGAGGGGGLSGVGGLGGARLPPLGPAAGLPEGVMTGARDAAGQGRVNSSGTGGGRGPGGAMAGMMPMGMMGGGMSPGGDSQNARNTWLKEDDDMFGTDDGAVPPGVLDH